MLVELKDANEHLWLKVLQLPRNQNREVGSDKKLVSFVFWNRLLTANTFPSGHSSHPWAMKETTEGGFGYCSTSTLNFLLDDVWDTEKKFINFVFTPKYWAMA